MKKRCSSCGLEKEVNDFYMNAGTRDGYSSICKECQNKISAKYAKDNKEKLREYKKARYQRRKKEFEELRRLAEEHGLNKRDN